MSNGTVCSTSSGVRYDSNFSFQTVISKITYLLISMPHGSITHEMPVMCVPVGLVISVKHT